MVKVIQRKKEKGKREKNVTYHTIIIKIMAVENKNKIFEYKKNEHDIYKTKNAVNSLRIVISGLGLGLVIVNLNLTQT